MKVASVEWQWSELKEMDRPEALMYAINEYLAKAVRNYTDIIVFPAFTGCFYQQLKTKAKSLQELKEAADHEEYISIIKKLSGVYKMAICPGSYWKKEGSCVYHASCIFLGGEVQLEQKQIYLARWERELGIARGVEVGLKLIKGLNTGIILSTDVFYPQVSRMLALMGAELILSPVGFTGKKSEALQISGMWQETQQNLFFTAESGFNGVLGGSEFWGESIIHAPLEMTQGEDGFLSRSEYGKNLIYAGLDNEQWIKAISGFDVLSRLNPEFYSCMQMFGGG